MNTPNTQVSAAPSPSDDPPGMNGRSSIPTDELGDVFSVLHGPAQPRQQTVETETQTQAQTQTPAQPQVQPGTQQPQVNLVSSHQQPGTQPQVQPQAQPGNPPTPTPGAQPTELAPILNRLATVLERPAASAPGQTQAQPQTPAYAQVPDYGYNIPPQVMAGLSSEDPQVATQALGTILTGVSRNVHQVVMQSARQMIQQSLIPHIKQEMQNAIAAAEIFRDFYGDYKDLNDERFRPLIVSEAERLAKTQGPNFSYGPNFKQALAQAVYALLGRQVPGAQPQGHTQQQVQTPAAPPGMVGGGNGGRPMGGMAARSEQDEIAELVSFRG